MICSTLNRVLGSECLHPKCLQRCDSNADDGLVSAWQVTLTGLRKGELFGLALSSVILSEGVLVACHSVSEVASGLHVKPPKTTAGRRIVKLSNESMTAVQNRLQKAESEGLGPEDYEIVFPGSRGGHQRASNFDRSCWYPVRNAAGLPSRLRFMT